MPKQQLHGFGAFFFVVGVLLLIVSFLVALLVRESHQVLAAGAIVGFAVSGGICFVAAAITLRASSGSSSLVPDQQQAIAEKKNRADAFVEEARQSVTARPTDQA